MSDYSKHCSMSTRQTMQRCCLSSSSPFSFSFSFIFSFLFIFHSFHSFLFLVSLAVFCAYKAQSTWFADSDMMLKVPSEEEDTQKGWNHCQYAREKRSNREGV